MRDIGGGAESSLKQLSSMEMGAAITLMGLTYNSQWSSAAAALLCKW